MKQKKAEYKETLQLIGIGLRPEQVMEQLSSKDYMDRYEEKIQEEINKEEVLKGATKNRKDDNTILVITEEGWIYKVTEDEVILLGNREEYPEPPDLQEAEIKFTYAPSGWTNGNVKVSITAKADKFSIQYAIKDPNDENSWQSYPSTGVVMTENGNIYARLSNELGETTAWATGNVSKIDRTNPNLNVTTGTITTSSIAVNVSASDTPSGLATSNAYRYYLNGTLVPVATGSSYNFTSLNASTNYTIKVVVYDKAGNSAEQEIKAQTKALNVEESKGIRYPNTTIIQDAGGNSVKIPGGFTVSTESANNVADGVVIQNDSGDQFVWIPIRQASDLHANLNYPKYNYPSSNRNKLYDVENWNQTGWSDLDADFIVQAGGFYVGRFEMGWTNKMVIKQGVETYHSMSLNTALSQSGKVHKTSTARTTLMTGWLWDAVMRFVHNKRAGDGHIYNVNAQNNRCSISKTNRFLSSR